MALYTVGRRRVIIALLLTSVLLLTLDIRGNPVLDRVRDGFSRIMEPFESATDVVTTPATRAWHGMTNYDDLERENQALQDQLDRLIGTQATARISVQEYQELRALLNLPSLAGIPTEVAQVVGASANNLDQIIEINKGRSSGFKVGMPVVNQAGLIGKITSVTDNTAKVMLITDARYVVPVRVQAAPDDAEQTPVETRPSGRTDEELRDLVTTTSAPPTTLATDVLDTGTVLPQGDDGTVPVTTVEEPTDPDETAPVETDPGEPAVEATTTTIATDLAPKEFGALEGRGRGLLPQIRFLQDNPGLATLQVGDLVVTAGGADSLAPPDIPVGVVINRADRSGPGGPLLDIQPYADVTKLNFVRVVKYTPLSEVER
ncbi:MAG: rod shape-determining protein MreC [Ilumatobacter sp.]|nr:rod shape-determining protein MreC [Ilumatobacter sp.]